MRLETVTNTYIDHVYKCDCGAKVKGKTAQLLYFFEISNGHNMFSQDTAVSSGSSSVGGGALFSSASTARGDVGALWTIGVKSVKQCTVHTDEWLEYAYKLTEFIVFY